MRKVKIKDLATEISITVKDVLSKCKDLSIIARSSASSISEDDAAKIKISFSPDNDKVKKSPRDVIKRSGAKVTIRRKKAPVFKIEEKTEDEQEVAKEKQAEEQVSKEEIKEEIKTKQDSQPTKTVTRETKRVYSPAKTNERDVKPKSKDDKQTNVTKEPPAKIQKEFRSEDAKKKTETKSISIKSNV